MPRLPEGYRLRLDPQDEYPHPPEAATTYNESMYFNLFDPDRRIGGWFRIGNRPNEGHAEISVCVYLPGGQVAFTFARPAIADNRWMKAGGLEVAVVEPFRHLRLAYEGRLLLLDDPLAMADPRQAFAANPQVNARIDLDFHGVSPVWGGETVRADGQPLDLDAERSFARAHYEQHVEGHGRLTIGDRIFELRGFGLRDKSWGPRTWQAIPWYRWCPMNFGRDFAMMISIVGRDDGPPRVGGMVLNEGRYDEIVEARIDSDWDAHGYQTGLRARVATESGAAYEVEGRVLSLIPLRNRRTGPDGVERTTRITEGFTEYRCNGRLGFGMSEYLDVLEDGWPVGPDVRRAGP
ncbi:MAG: hypothetical protein NZM40_04735 [Sphingomonadaceae bacterium]|uniref:DUF7064 domain-containing protein n=1 Tax=Thermaurantiacus sp. TaxID=2820283 RepID=UPI00298EE8C9|nr:hypothetical protein [Thermaurantiacus sp.]MCS6986728.1 hypothetical protein [Sphingomonadaceae bacterium]MDW8414009.1 hypothetical protein [Thermaurantiacus sp.]